VKPPLQIGDGRSSSSYFRTLSTSAAKANIPRIRSHGLPYLRQGPRSNASKRGWPKQPQPRLAKATTAAYRKAA
jgi:hypothetical protein